MTSTGELQGGETVKKVQKMFNLYYKVSDSKVNHSLIKLTQTDDISAGLIILGFRLRFRRDRKGKLWVMDIPLKVFVKTAQAEFRRAGYQVSRVDIETTLLALAHMRER